MSSTIFITDEGAELALSCIGSKSDLPDGFEHLYVKAGSAGHGDEMFTLNEFIYYDPSTDLENRKCPPSPLYRMIGRSSIDPRRICYRLDTENPMLRKKLGGRTPSDACGIIRPELAARETKRASEINKYNLHRNEIVSRLRSGTTA